MGDPASKGADGFHLLCLDQLLLQLLACINRFSQLCDIVQVPEATIGDTIDDNGDQVAEYGPLVF